MLVVQGAPLTAVVRSSTGEPVILLTGNPPEQLPQTTYTDMIKAAAAVLSAAELHTLNTALPTLGTDPPDFHIQHNGNQLTIHRLTAN